MVEGITGKIKTLAKTAIKEKRPNPKRIIGRVIIWADKVAAKLARKDKKLGKQENHLLKWGAK